MGVKKCLALSLCLSIYSVICLCWCFVFIYIFFSIYLHLFVYLSIYLSVYLLYFLLSIFICSFIYLFINLLIYFLLIRNIYFIYLLLELFLLNQNRCDDEIKLKTHLHACSCLQPEAKTEFSRLLGTNIILSWREVKKFLTCSHAVFENIFCSLKVREEMDREDLLASQHSWADVQVFHRVSRYIM